MRALTGIKPTAQPHLGNLVGAIGPGISLSREHDCIYFIADYHALTTLHDRAAMRTYVYEGAATWLALGLDPQRSVLFQQSDAPEVTELSWLLSCICGLGLLDRGHAVKAARDGGHDINAGVFNYPVLMAADILAYDTNVVPVGQDQKQHVEMTRDMAVAFNHRFGEVLVVPEVLLQKEGAVVSGLDGRKMSKSYNNTVPLFATSKQLRKLIMSITTDSRGMEEPKDPETCNIFAIFRLFASEAEQADLAARYRAGGLGYGHAKQELFEVLDRRFAEPREHFAEWMANPARLDAVLADGAERARVISRATLERAREAVGFQRVQRRRETVP